MGKEREREREGAGVGSGEQDIYIILELCKTWFTQNKNIFIKNSTQLQICWQHVLASMLCAFALYISFISFRALWEKSQFRTPISPSNMTFSILSFEFPLAYLPLYQNFKSALNAFEAICVLLVASPPPLSQFNDPFHPFSREKYQFERNFIEIDR